MNLYIRFFANIFKNLLFPSKCTPFDETSLSMRVLPNDLDANMHMNNGRFLTIMDIGRMDFTMRIGFHKTMIKEKWGAVAAAINVAYMRPLNLFDKYELKTKALTWDDQWFYMEQSFVKKNNVVASAIVKAAFLDKGKRVNPKVVMEKSGIESPLAPEFPNYLNEMIEGENAFIQKIKEQNKASMNQ